VLKKKESEFVEFAPLTSMIFFLLSGYLLQWLPVRSSSKFQQRHLQEDLHRLQSMRHGKNDGKQKKKKNKTKQKTIWIWCTEESLYTQQDSSNLKSGTPLVFQDVQANSSELVDVRVVNLCEKSHFWRSHWVFFGEEQL
jgi:hypothetical protein